MTPHSLSSMKGGPFVPHVVVIERDGKMGTL